MNEFLVVLDMKADEPTFRCADGIIQACLEVIQWCISGDSEHQVMYLI